MSSLKKNIAFKIKMEVTGGTLKPSDKGVGPSLGGKVNSNEFCKQFNAATKSMEGERVRVVIYAYKDKTFDFEIKGSPVPYQLLKLAKKISSAGDASPNISVKLEKGSSEPNKKKVGSLSMKDIELVASNQMSFMNSFTKDRAVSMILGTAKRMGLIVTD